MQTRPADISFSLSSQPSGTDDRFLSSVGMRVPPALGWDRRFRLPTGRKGVSGTIFERGNEFRRLCGTSLLTPLFPFGIFCSEPSNHIFIRPGDGPVGAV